MTTSHDTRMSTDQALALAARARRSLVELDSAEHSDAYRVGALAALVVELCESIESHDADLRERHQRALAELRAELVDSIERT